MYPAAGHISPRRLTRSGADPEIRSITRAFQFSPNSLRARMRHSQQIARFLGLPQILQHQRQIRLPDGYGGVSGLERLDQIGQKDGKCTRVILDSELKRIVYRDLAHARRASNSPDFAAIAERNGLKLIRGTIPVPDLRVEYETADRQQARVDLELATEHYRFKNLAKKASAGFSMYARPDEVSKLRRVMDERELIAEIMSL